VRETAPLLFYDGIPADVPDDVAAVARSRLASAYEGLSEHTDTGQLVLQVGSAHARDTGSAPRPGSGIRVPEPARDQPADGEETIASRARQYVATTPKFGFDQLVMSADQADALLTAVAATGLRPKLYGEWGLRRIEPSPSAALNLHGPPGTGKTLAAHAIAARLGRPIIMAGYAELESKFHGDGPKNVKAAFHAAQTSGALLFIDEADSLLSRRLTDVNQGSEQAINSMRSQIVLCLDEFSGVVVFATNLVSNYDRAFESRVRHFHFALPGPEARLAIWHKLLVPELPRDADVDIDHLAAATDGFSGREIKLAILTAAERAALADQDAVRHADFATAIAQLTIAREQLKAADGRQAPPDGGTVIAAARPVTSAEADTIESDLRSQGVRRDCGDVNLSHSAR
jgi:SpoVK/Ycf46/Vps4 family AAA+-type ATPase